jgi:hypothetical protein
MDGAVRPIHHACIEVPLASGAFLHIYRRDEIYVGNAVKQIMRHCLTKATWEKKNDGNRSGRDDGDRCGA